MEAALGEEHPTALPQVLLAGSMVHSHGMHLSNLEMYWNASNANYIKVENEK
jgi:hypothetical protein